MTASGPTLVHDLLRHAAERPDAVALRDKHRGIWRETTWAGYADRVARAAAGLQALGVGPGDRVAVHAENRPEWLVADLAIQALGAATVGVYPTSSPAEVEHVVGHAAATVLVAEDEEQLDKALAVRDRLPELRHIAVVDLRGVGDDAGVTPWATVEEHAPADLAGLAQALDPEATATLVYTSGTTGPPKGAMLSHRNLQAAARACREVWEVGPDDEVLSYLPLCHVAERLFSVVNAVGTGYVVHFGEGGSAPVDDLREVQPTVFLGVPRVWEKLLAGVEIRMADAGAVKRAAYRLGLRLGERTAPARMAEQAGAGDRLRFALSSLVVGRALRHKLGMGRVRIALSGAAPIAPQVLQWLWAIGVPVREGYGQTENTALATFTPRGDVRLGTVGRALPGVELRLAEDGEVLTRCEGVFQGYFKDPDATAATVDADGWLHTGDVGELDADGFLTITDRKKDIIITAGGKNISPSEIENRLKVSPFVREAMVVGDRRKFLVALIGIELDTVGDWATRRGIAYTTYRDLSHKPEVRELVAGWVEEVNADLAQVETVKRFALLDKELDPEDGELTPTLKLKRRAMEERFAREIEELYASDAPAVAAR
ncbi:long-chain fatty acid--CoA ligase [Conexibacter sp. SYSU D00693]|uniref:AMP-dependent synthetase/ligase n=1 Tax=Conexibacter sp. SYSU D00693 TaxID=2812560 RepID=UPI00196A9F69|nr:AMP-binding protein [Conexibacter sp. SYSU D00693]